MFRVERAMDLDFGLEDISLRGLSVVQRVGVRVEDVERDVNRANILKTLSAGAAPQVKDDE